MKRILAFLLAAVMTASVLQAVQIQEMLFQTV